MCASCSPGACPGFRCQRCNGRYYRPPLDYCNAMFAQQHGIFCGCGPADTAALQQGSIQRQLLQSASAASAASACDDAASAAAAAASAASSSSGMQASPSRMRTRVLPASTKQPLSLPAIPAALANSDCNCCRAEQPSTSDDCFSPSDNVFCKHELLIDMRLSTVLFFSSTLLCTVVPPS